MANEGQAWYRHRVTDALGLVSDQLVQVNAQVGGAMAGLYARMAGTQPAQRGIHVIDNTTGVCPLPLVHIEGNNNVRTGPALRIGLTGAALIQNVIEIAPADNAALAAAGEARIRYDHSALSLQASLDGNAWAAFAVVGGNTLQAAYGVGDTIATTAAQGSIIFTHASAIGQSLLTINDASALASTASLVLINCTSTARTTGHLFQIINAANTFQGHLVDLVLGGTNAVQQALVLTLNDGGNNTWPAVQLINNVGSSRTTGPILEINQDAAAFLGDAVRIDISAGNALSQALTIEDSTAAGTAFTAALVVIESDNNNRTTGPLLLIDQGGTGFTGDAVQIAYSAGAAAGQALVITDTSATATTAALVQILNANGSGRTSGPLLEVESEDTTFAGYAVRIELDDCAIQGKGLQVQDASAAATNSFLCRFNSSNGSRIGGILQVDSGTSACTQPIMQINQGFNTQGASALRVICDGGTNPDPGVEIYTTVPASRTGPLLRVYYSSNGASTIPSLVDVDIVGNNSATTRFGRFMDNANGTAFTVPMVEIESLTNASRVARTAPLLQLQMNAGSEATVPHWIAGATGFFQDAGVPNNANGNDQDIYYRNDGAAGTKIYGKFAGAWAALA